MSFYHWKRKLTKDPCKLLCLVQQSWDDDMLQYLVSVRIYRYADICTQAPEHFCLQKRKVKQFCGCTVWSVG